MGDRLLFWGVPHGSTTTSTFLVFRRDQSALHTTLAEFPSRRVIPHPEGLINRGTVAEWSAGERLELPLHQINVYRTADEYLARADKRMLAHDRADFDSAEPALDSESRPWLRPALLRTAPDSEWLRGL